VKCQITWFGVDGHDWEIPFATPMDPMLGVSMGPGQHQDLPIFSVGLVQLDTGLNKRTHHRVASTSVVCVPSQITIPFDNPGILDEDHWSVETVATWKKVLVNETSKTCQTWITCKFVKY